MQDLIHEEAREGFTIRLYRKDEYCSPVGNVSAIDDETDAAILADIASGRLDWFAVKVSASKNGIELGADYLGGCCYESASAFVTPGEDYWEDMVSNAIADAKKTLAALASH